MTDPEPDQSGLDWYGCKPPEEELHHEKDDHERHPSKSSAWPKCKLLNGAESYLLSEEAGRRFISLSTVGACNLTSCSSHVGSSTRLDPTAILLRATEYDLVHFDWDFLFVTSTNGKCRCAPASAAKPSVCLP
jgi:hypothetical protein